MATPSPIELARQKRKLRAEIARSRRAIERHATALARQTRTTLSWRHWVRTFPLPAVVSAFGLGLLISAGLGRRTARAAVRGVFGLALATFWRQALSQTTALVWDVWQHRRRRRQNASMAQADAPSSGSASRASSAAAPSGSFAGTPSASSPTNSDRQESATP